MPLDGYKMRKFIQSTFCFLSLSPFRCVFFSGYETGQLNGNAKSFELNDVKWETYTRTKSNWRKLVDSIFHSSSKPFWWYGVFCHFNFKRIFNRLHVWSTSVCITKLIQFELQKLKTSKIFLHQSFTQNFRSNGL